MLFLSTHPTLVHDQKPGDHFRGFGTEIIIDQRQYEVDPRGHSRRRPDRTVIDEDPASVRKCPASCFEMRCCAALLVMRVWGVCAGDSLLKALVFQKLPPK